MDYADSQSQSSPGVHESNNDMKLFDAAVSSLSQPGSPDAQLCSSTTSLTPDSYRAQSAVSIHTINLFFRNYPN